jgi:hypothetical protein
LTAIVLCTVSTTVVALVVGKTAVVESSIKKLGLAPKR